MTDLVAGKSLPPPPPAPPGGRMSFFEHLDELRRRLIHASLAVLVTTLASFHFANDIITWLRYPVDAIAHAGRPLKLVTVAPTDAFVVDVKVSLAASLLVCTPFLLLQVWLFVAPGLYPHERRWVWPFVVLGTLFFAGGAAFCFYLVLPATLEYLLATTPPGVEAQWSLEFYFALITHLMLGFGLVFELPLVMTILGATGLVSAKAFVRFRRYWIVLAAVVAGVITPTPDALTMLMMATPLWVFYEVGILGARFLRRPTPRTGGVGL